MRWDHWLGGWAGSWVVGQVGVPLDGRLGIGLLDGRMGRRVTLGGTYAGSKRAWRISCSAGMLRRSCILVPHCPLPSVPYRHVAAIQRPGERVQAVLEQSQGPAPAGGRIAQGGVGEVQEGGRYSRGPAPAGGE